MESKATALVVEADVLVREQLGQWLERAGFDVLSCSGPTAPDYSCTGIRGGSCPLAKAADLVVLDLHLASDEAGEGTPAFELLFLYGRHGLPMVVLTDHQDPVLPSPEPRMAVVGKPVRRRDLVAAARSVLATKRRAASRCGSPGVHHVAGSTAVEGRAGRPWPAAMYGRTLEP